MATPLEPAPASAKNETARAVIFALLPLVPLGVEIKDSGVVPWTTRQLCVASGLAWESVSRTVWNLQRSKLVRKVGGTRGHGYLWVRNCEALPPDRRGYHGHQPRGAKHYTALRGRAARPPRLRTPSNAHDTPLSVLDVWPRPITLRGGK